MLDLIEENVDKFPPDVVMGMLEKLRQTIGEDLFDVDTWKGLWTMLNYSLEYQTDVIQRRLTGEYETDEWGLDAVVGGSQKGVMIPPGLAYVALSQRAISKMKAGRHAVYYFDLLKAVASAEKNDTPYTPAITIVLALQKALEMMRAEGIENVVARHSANASAVRAAVKAGDDERAAQLTELYLADPDAGQDLRRELCELVEPADAAVAARFPRAAERYGIARIRRLARAVAPMSAPLLPVV